MKKLTFCIFLFTLALSFAPSTPAVAQKAKTGVKTKAKSKGKTKTKAKPKTKKTEKKETSATKDGNNTPVVNVPLDLWNVEKDPQTELLYYLNAETGKPVGETGFDYAAPFQKEQPLAEVRIRDDRYVMARNGCSLLDHPAFTVLYDEHTHYVQIMDKMSSFLMDFHGRAISAGYDFMLPVSPYLFGVTGSTDQTLKIIGIDDKPITPTEVQHIGQNSLQCLTLLDNRDTTQNSALKDYSALCTLHSALLPAYIMYRQDDKSGLMNYAGETIIPAEYDQIEQFIPSAAKPLPKALRDKFTAPAYERLLFFFCSNSKNPAAYTVYDQAGQQVAKLKGESPDKIYDKNFKKVFSPFLQKNQGNPQLTDQNVYSPYYSFILRMAQYDDSLPKTVRPSTLNLFDKAKERFNSKKTLQSYN